METTLKLRLFGSPTVEEAGRSVTLPFERRSQIVVLLALRRGWVPRAELAALLWPEQPSKQAYTNLRKILFRLPDVPWAAGIESQGAALRLQAPTDVGAFETALQEQRSGDALAAYRGELLAGFDDGPGEAWTQWLAFERERLRVAWRGAALARLAQEVPAAEAVALSAQLLEADPLDEAALRAHMDALARDGQTAAARLAWRRFVERLSQDLGLEPGAELRALHDALGGAPAAAPSAEAPAAAPADDGFVGRSVELRRIADLLGGPECRLLCLVGPGGIGKTRLARRALALLAPQFADGVRVVGLEDIDTPAQFGQRLAQEAGTPRERGGSGDALARTVNAWRDRELLLLLDNFEPLAEHAALLEPLLQGCPRLKILVTTRVRLAVAGEWSMPLEGLPCPDPEDGDRAASFDAVRLFVKAAQRVEPGFAAASESAAIVDICRQVDGLPLALELAAAWVRVLPCAAIADELRQGSELLRTHDASRPARHASIEVVFEHSWQRLSAVEREVLARLSVFSGGFTAEAARAVAGASLPVLGALADKSLLAKNGERLQLHPLVHQMAALRLAALPDAEQAQAAAAHAQHFLRVLAHGQQRAWAGEAQALRAIEADFENARRAWQQAIAAGSTDGLADSATALVGFCEHRARIEDALELLAPALESTAVRADRTLEATLRSLFAHVEFRLDRYPEARASATRALQALRQGSGVEPRLLCLLVLGRCAMALTEPALARALLGRALGLSAASRHAGARASVLGTLALVERVAGDSARALTLSLEVLEEQRRLNNPAGEAQSLNTVAALLLDLRRFEQAATYLKPALALCDRHGLVSTRGQVLSNLTGAAMELGDDAAAEGYALRALEHARAAGNRGLVSLLNLMVVTLALRRTDLPAAREALRESLHMARAIGRRSLQDHGLQRFADLLHAQGEVLGARQVLRFLLAQPDLQPQISEEFAALLDGWGPGGAEDWAWPAGLGHAELAQRVVDETGLAHAPLIAELRAATTVTTN